MKLDVAVQFPLANEIRKVFISFLDHILLLGVQEERRFPSYFSHQEMIEECVKINHHQPGALNKAALKTLIGHVGYILWDKANPKNALNFQNTGRVILS